MSSRVIPYPVRGAARPARTLNPKFPLRQASVVEFPVKNVQSSVEPVESDKDGLSCARGVGVALMIESVAALALYWFWVFLHLHR